MFIVSLVLLTKTKMDTISQPDQKERRGSSVEIQVEYLARLVANG